MSPITRTFTRRILAENSQLGAVRGPVASIHPKNPSRGFFGVDEYSHPNRPPAGILARSDAEYSQKEVAKWMSRAEPRCGSLHRKMTNWRLGTSSLRLSRTRGLKERKANMTRDEEIISMMADGVMREFTLTPTQFWGRAEVGALVLEIERLRQGPTPTPEPTFWLGADACAP